MRTRFNTPNGIKTNDCRKVQLTQEQHDNVQRLHNDQAFNYIGAPMFSAYGKSEDWLPNLK